MKKILLTLALLGVGSVVAGDLQRNTSQDIIARYMASYEADFQGAINALVSDFKTHYNVCPNERAKELYIQILANRLNLVESIKPNIDIILAMIMSDEEVTPSVEAPTAPAAAPAIEPVDTVIAPTAVEQEEVAPELLKTNADLSTLVRTLKSIATIQNVGMKAGIDGAVNVYDLGYTGNAGFEITLQLEYNPSTKTIIITTNRDTELVDNRAKNEFTDKLIAIINPKEDISIEPLKKAAKKLKSATSMLSGLIKPKARLTQANVAQATKPVEVVEPVVEAETPVTAPAAVEVEAQPAVDGEIVSPAVAADAQAEAPVVAKATEPEVSKLQKAKSFAIKTGMIAGTAYAILSSDNVANTLKALADLTK